MKFEAESATSLVFAGCILSSKHGLWRTGQATSTREASRVPRFQFPTNVAEFSILIGRLRTAFE